MKLQRFCFENIEQARKFVIAIRKSLSQRFVEYLSRRIQMKIMETEEFRKSSNIACFVGAKGEPDTSLILEKWREKNIFLPRVLNEDKAGLFLYKGKLKDGKFGIKEPDSEETAHISKIELFIVPGVLFDSRGFRVGYGKGYYDRLLEGVNKNIFALCWSFQVFDKIPYERKWDVFVHKIFTELFVLDTKTGKMLTID